MPEKNLAAPLYDDCPCRCCKKDDLCNKKPTECKTYKTWFATKWRRITNNGKGA